jgi:two-component system, chemotaxis family, chemotaxis protein CheY
MRILVVDDESVSRRKMELIMRSFGQCDTVESGAAAIESFANAWENWAPFDLISLDLLMPEMNGDEVIKKIREMEKNKSVPEDKQVRIMVVTAKSDKDSIITCIQAGCNEYIVKPFDRPIVQEKLAKIFPLKRPWEDASK